MAKDRKWLSSQSKGMGIILKEDLPTVSMEGVSMSSRIIQAAGIQAMSQNPYLNPLKSLEKVETTNPLMSEQQINCLEIGQPTLVSTNPKESADDYHADRAYISNSTLRSESRSLAHYKYRVDNPSDSKSRSLEIGSAVHTCALEPHSFKDKYERATSSDKRTKAWKEQEAAVPNGVTLLKSEDYELIESIVLNLSNHASASKLLYARGRKIELSIRFEIMGLKLKCKPDVFIEGDELIHVELKTARDASLKGFEKAISDYDIHEQMYFHGLGIKALTGIAPDRRIIVAVENEAPYPVAVYELDPATMEKAQLAVDARLVRIAEAYKTNNFPAYPSEIQFNGLPHWRW